MDWSHALAESNKQKTIASQNYPSWNQNQEACRIAAQHITFINDTLWKTQLDSMISKIHHKLSLKEGQRIVVEPFESSVHRPGDTISSPAVSGSRTLQRLILLLTPIDQMSMLTLEPYLFAFPPLTKVDQFSFRWLRGQGSSKRTVNPLPGFILSHGTMDPWLISCPLRPELGS